MYAVHLFFLCQFTDQSTTNCISFASPSSTWSTWSTWSSIWSIYSTRYPRSTKYTWSSSTELYIYISINQTTTNNCISTINHTATNNRTSTNNHTATWLVSVNICTVFMR